MPAQQDDDEQTWEPDLGPWARAKSPFLIESQIEDYGRLAQNHRQAPAWARWTLYGMLFLMAAPVVALVVLALVQAMF